VRWLQERNVKIWNEWEIDENGDWIDIKTGKVLKHFDPSMAHTIGTAYGYIVKKYGLIDRLINSLKNDINDRRRVMSLWQDAELETAVLPSCVWSSEWDITNGKLNVWVHQRSCDTALGLPFNVTQYAVLQSMLAQVCGLQPGTLDWSIKDAHLYVNQIDGIKEQLARYETNGSYPAPKLWLNPDVTDFYDFDNSKDCKDVKLVDYKHMGAIRFPITQ
jgi:thymidylate synthase